ncbi:MAG TPA: D-amino-acid transaminase [Chondromyces sp.]|nr:D-amino-acid transaminase [Chondromyces sp.]
MTIAYFNGEYISPDQPVIPIDERGHQFGDGIYEVIRVYNQKPFMLDEHIERLFTSADAIKLNIGKEKEEMKAIISELIQKSNLENLDIYLQITRGVAPRAHLFPDCPVSISMTAKPFREMPEGLREKGISIIFHEDERWSNCYIKSLNLLPNILAKQTASEQGCYEAVLVRDGYITEGTSSNVFIVKNGELWTTPLSNRILHGVTRLAVTSIAEKLAVPLIEKHFTAEDLLHADEAFITSTTSEILPITQAEGKIVGKGTPGEITKKLYKEFQTISRSFVTN